MALSGDAPFDSSPFQAALGLNAAAMAVIDDKGTITGWTPGAEQMLDLTATDVVGKSAALLLHSGTAESRDVAGVAGGPGAEAVAEAGAGNRTAAEAGSETGAAPLEPAGSEAETSSADGTGAAWATWAGVAAMHKHWSGMKDLRHRDGHAVRVNIEAVPLTSGEGGTYWFLWAAELGQAETTPSVRASVMRTLLDHSPIALAIWDTDLTCVWLNTTAEHEAGAFRHREAGVPMSAALDGFDTPTVESVMRQVLADGKQVIDHEFRWTSPDGTDERVFSSSFFRLDTAAGVPVGVCAVSMDITRSWARARLSLLSKVSRQVGTTLDVSTTAQELADVTVPLLADFVAVDLAESVPLGEEPQERLASADRVTAARNVMAHASTDADFFDTRIPLYRRAAVSSIHEGVPESLRDVGEVVFVRPASPFFDAAASGTSFYQPDFGPTWDRWMVSEPERMRLMRDTGMHSLMVVPLKARGAILGVAVFGRTENVAPFSRDDLLLAEELGLQAGLSIDNARRYTRERTAALALQRNLMPRSLSGGTAVDVGSRYLPTDAHEGVGGDWFDVIPLPGARVALVIGDVVGHGINAAATMGRFRTAVHTLADLDLPPDELLAHLDDLAVHLSESEVEREEGDGGFSLPTLGATCVYAVYDAVTQICTVARAGHPPPAIVDPAGFVTFPEMPAGAPIGLGLGSYESVELKLAEGSVIAMYTDGLVETRTEDLDTGLERFAEAVAAGGTEQLDAKCAQVIDTMTENTGTEDDVALLLARTRALGPSQVATWELTSDPATVRKARARVAERLTEWGLKSMRPTVELIVSELVTNAVRHGTAPIRLRLIRHSTLVCEVSDADNSSPRLRHARVTEETGRGLFLVSKTADRWGSRFTPEGKITWAEIDMGAGEGE